MATRFKNDLSGLEALLEAAKFVELQDKLKNGLVYSISSKIEEAPLSPLSSQKRPSSPITATNGSSRTKASQSPPVAVATGGAAALHPVSSSSNGFSARSQYVSGPAVPLLSSLALVSSTVPAPTVSVAALPSSGVPPASLLFNFQNGRSSHTLHHQYHHQQQQQPIRIPPRTQHHISAFSPTRTSPLNAISCSPSSPSQSSTPPPHFAQRNLSAVSSVGHALMSRHHDHMGYIDQNSDQYRRPSPTYIGSVPPSSALITTSAAEVRRRLGASGTREVHNKLEKNRRAHLKECFELLKCQVPSTQDEKKTSNLTVLRSAIRYIQILKRRERENEQEVERLAREKTMNQQRLCALKKELQAQWDHIDFNALIPDPIEIAPVQRRAEFLTGQNYCSPHLNGSNGMHDERRSSEIEKNGIGIMMLVSDTDESSSQPRSRADTLYSSTSSSMSSFSPPNTQSSMCSSSENFTSQHSQLIDASSAGSPVQFTTNSPVQFTSNASSLQYNEDEPIALVSDNKSVQYPNTIFTRASPPSDKIAAIAITEPSQRIAPSNGILPNATCQNVVISSAMKLTMPNRFAVSAGNDVRPIKFTTVPRTVSSTKVISTSDFKAANQMPILNGHHQYFIKSAISATPTSFESSLR